MTGRCRFGSSAARRQAGRLANACHSRLGASGLHAGATLRQLVPATVAEVRIGFRVQGQGLAAPARRPPPLNGELGSHALPKASDEPEHRFGGRLSVVEPGPRPDELSELIDRALAQSEAILIDQPGKDAHERLSDLVVGSPLGVNAIEELLPFVSSQVLLHGADGMDCSGSVLSNSIGGFAIDLAVTVTRLAGSRVS